MPSLKRDNSFDLVRLLAALAVLSGHQWLFSGLGRVPRIGGLPVHSLGVSVFFALSGYLISGSWSRDAHAGRFLLRRARRILPALAAVVFVTIFVLGPVLTSLPVIDYFRDGRTWAHLENAVLIGHYRLPGVFEEAWRHSNAVNGSLWTLGLEFCCYVAVLVVGVLSHRLNSSAPAVIWVFLSVLLVVVTVTGVVGAELRSHVILTTFFAVGAAIRLCRLDEKVHWGLGAVGAAAWIALGVGAPQLAEGIAWLVLPMSVIALGRLPFIGASVMRKSGDLSYGTYLWAFPVQQVVVGWGLSAAPLELLAVLIVTLTLAALSWRFVERPALHVEFRSLLARGRMGVPG